jgi:AGZA family xanthine/uracil permease-like MFS transporter
LGAVTVFIIDREFVKASAFAAAGAVLTFFGFIHGEAIGIASSPGVAFAYAGVAAILFACAKYAEVVPTTLDPHDHVAVAAPAE